ncbi:uncharacterized protein LOC125266262 isoform X1 [Megalobrama amblycephala]|uniref:uncharacterized protein LOC125266262 isoform X1 n=1 Tax=Megalobrama amblycephala TaxID=75352 RepID=UPI002014467C|nr:uncharacterized protein LOC125266262 isoform X1 [Megalobrama amblycephala]
MSDKCDLCLLGLIILCSLLTGTSGVNDAHVFISSGEDVRLRCNNALSDCNSTTWIYNRFRHSVAVELITLGKKKKDTERHERLSLGSDCSLNIKNVTKEDPGFYSCQQYVNDKQQGTDAHVYLHVLHVSSSSSSQTEISPGRSVTLSCQLYSYDGESCDRWARSGEIHLLWVNQSDVDLKTDSRYQISASGLCIINLTTTLLKEDDNREWRCRLTHRNQNKTSVRYTVKYSAQDDSTTAVIPVHTTNSQDPSTIKTPETKAQDVTTKAVIPVHTTNSQDPSTIKTPETKDQNDSVTAVIPVHTTNSQDPSTIKTPETKDQDVTKNAVIPVHTTNSQDPSTIKTPETKAQDVTTKAVIPVHTTNSQDPSTIKTPENKAQDVTTTAVIPVHTTNSQDPSTIKTPETKDQDVTTKAVIPVHTTNSQDPSTIKTPETKIAMSTTATSLIPETTPKFLKPVSLSVIGIVGASFAVLLLALILWMILKKRADNRRRTDDSVEQTDDHVTYTEVTVCSKNQGKKKKVHCDDKVTYSSIRGAKVGAPENCSELYASVNKNHHKSVE